jgi:hypothetical protein
VLIPTKGSTSNERQTGVHAIRNIIRNTFMFVASIRIKVNHPRTFCPREKQQNIGLCWRDHAFLFA